MRVSSIFIPPGYLIKLLESVPTEMRVRGRVVHVSGLDVNLLQPFGDVAQRVLVSPQFRLVPDVLLQQFSYGDLLLLQNRQRLLVRDALTFEVGLEVHQGRGHLLLERGRFVLLGELKGLPHDVLQDDLWLELTSRRFGVVQQSLTVVEQFAERDVGRGRGLRRFVICWRRLVVSYLYWSWVFVPIGSQKSWMSI